MKLHHIAFWTRDIDALVAFYSTHFDGEVLFRHQAGDFKCVFVNICSSINLEFMTRSNLPNGQVTEPVGYSHFSVEVESKEEVNRLTDYFIANNIPLQKIKEQYDDGFYESSVIDPDGNIIEIAFVDRTVNNAV
ncbi:MAG: VOC family protein [Anaerolineaceae bacterium]|nr:VOC family protein [Anaerolineaceae bacterium]